MGLTEIYRKGKQNLSEKEIGRALDAVETSSILEHT
jgi:hypothetical protein